MIKRYNIRLYNEDKLDKEYLNIKCIYNNNNISFILDGIKTIITENELIRENEEYKFYLNFHDKKSEYYLKTHKLKYNINVEHTSRKINKKEIIIKYKIEYNEELITIIIEESK